MSLTSTTHDLGPFFWHSISLKKKSPIIHRHPSHEPEYPYRWSNSLIIRWPGCSKGVVLGFWRKTDRTEEQAILAAMGGRGTHIDAIPEDQKVTIRRNLMRKDLSADAQLLISEALDLL